MMEVKLVFWCRVMYHDMPKGQVVIPLCTVYNTRILRTHMGYCTWHAWEIITVLIQPAPPKSLRGICPRGLVELRRILAISIISIGFVTEMKVLLRDFFCGMAGIMQLGHPKMNIVKAFSCSFCWLFRGKYLWQLAIWRVRAGTKGNTVHFVWQSELAITWPKNTHLTTIVSLFNFGGI